MTAPALKPSPRSDTPYPHPIKPLASSVTVVIMRTSTSSPGPWWDLVGTEPAMQGDHIRPATYRFNPAKASRDEMASRLVWAALHNANGSLPPRPPAQAGVHLKD